MRLSDEPRYLRLKKTLLFLYTALIIYFMFFAFHRTGRFQYRHFSWRFSSFPLWFPRQLNRFAISSWIFMMGNLLAFAPFGVLLPDCYKSALGRYRKSLFVFIMFITLLETIQYATKLGIFDVEDIVVNAIGYSIGFWAWRIADLIDDKVAKALTCVVLIGVFTLLSICFAEISNAYIFTDPYELLISSPPVL